MCYSLRVVILLTIFLLSANLVLAADSELKLVSPWGAVIRSAILPGWGQIHTGKSIQGVASFITTSSFLASGFIVWSSYKEIYDNEYVPSAQENLYSLETSKFYKKANQRYKLSQFFFFTGLAFWTYSLIDSYVEANLYNAELKADNLLKEIRVIENTELKVNMINLQIDLKFVTKF